MEITYYLHLIPLILGISFVYSGTRCEDAPSIIKQGFRIAYSISVFMLISFLILYFFFGC